MEDRIKNVERAIGGIERTNERIANSLERLVILETQHAETRAGLNRAFQAISENSEKIARIQQRQGLYEIAYNAIIGVSALIIVAAIGLIWYSVTGVQP